MMDKRRLGMLAAVLLIGLVASPSWGGAAVSVADLAEQAVAGDAAVAERATAALRAAGPAGLAALLSVHEPTIARARAGEVDAVAADPLWPRIRAAIDHVAGQRDAHASGLYWYTDLDAALAVAEREGKPVLSLRLLGRLDEEYSCANSRFFRTALYANQQVSHVLAEQFVLHWESVRPVPRITVDMGDGRRIERTLTGNSIHWVLDQQGRVVDALPGLYGPAAFLAGLDDAGQMAKQVGALEGMDHQTSLQGYHREQLRRLQTRWTLDLAELDVADAAAQLPDAVAREQADAPIARIDAVAADARAMAKSIVEGPLVRVVMMDAAALEAASDDVVWTRLAELHAAEATLDRRSIALMATKLPPGDGVGRGLDERLASDVRLRETVEQFQQVIASDTVRNEYQFRRQIHEWLADDAVGQGVAELNRRVYAELFLTPDEDPWLGLVPETGYSALDGAGLVQQVEASP